MCDADGNEHTEKYFMNLVNLNQTWIVITAFKSNSENIQGEKIDNKNRFISEF